MIDVDICTKLISREKLLEIIQFQLDLAKLKSDLSNTIELITSVAQKLTNADGASFEIAEGESMVYTAASGSSQSVLGQHLKIEKSLSGLCMKNGKMLYCKNVLNDSRVDKEFALNLKVRSLSLVVIPIKYNNTTMGVLKVVSKKIDFFKQEDLCVLSTIGKISSHLIYYLSDYASSSLFYKATHDSMTQLENRSVFYDRLLSLDAISKNQKIYFAVAVIDMNELKLINDSYGHRFGDAAIIEFARRLKVSSREHDTVARLGGDEFGLILKSVPSIKILKPILGRIDFEMNKRFIFDNITLPLKYSIGYSIYPIDSKDIHKLVELADTAMYKAKRL